MNNNKIHKSKFNNKFEYKMSKLSDEKIDRIDKIIIKRLCKLEAETLDFYDFKKNYKVKDKTLNG